MDNSSLNKEQLDAVTTIQGPVLVLAGAGSGKTRVVTHRIIHLIESGVSPSHILGLTFTNKAAEEMRERVMRLTHSRVLICTFHSLGVQILRRSIQPLGYNTDFVIYDEEDSNKILKDCLAEIGISDKKGEVKIYKNKISQAKNSLKTPDKLDGKELSAQEESLPRVYSLYQEKLKQYNAVDFDDLLFLPVQLFLNHPEILDHYQTLWPYLLIDEYQDTNVAQYTLVQLLVKKTQNIFVVGDPDQSIYSWRGANIQNILNFEKDYPGAKTIRLEQNYRSRKNILDAANALILHNENRYEKNLWSASGPGEKIRLFSADTEREEADFVSIQMQKYHIHHKIPYKDMVVFYRTNAQSRAFEDALLKLKIPYVVVGGISFYQRREIKDILAFLRIVQSPADFVSFQRTINIPKRGIGESTLDKIRLNSIQENMPILTYLEALIGEDTPILYPTKLTVKQKEGVKNYLYQISELRRLKNNVSLKELVLFTIDRTGYLDYLKEDKETFEDRKENLDALISKAMEWELSNPDASLNAFLEELSLKSTLDEAVVFEDRVNLMTIHNGKGLEFTLTFLAGMEEDLFPHINSKGNPGAIEEERRLCYVGITRAKEYLFLTYANLRMVWGTFRNMYPSRFLREIPQNYIDRIRRITL